MRWILIILLLLPLTISAQPNYYPDYWFSYDTPEISRPLAVDSIVGHMEPVGMQLDDLFFFAWRDEIIGMRYQLFDNYGVPMFDSPPLLASQHSDYWGSLLECHPDDNGGCYAVWSYADTVDSLWHIMAQHFNSSGDRTWGETGTIVHTLDAPPWAGYHDRSISPDGVGGLLCAFNYDNIIYLTRIDQNGSHVWGEEEVLICDAQNIRNDLAITHDGQG
ncbi:hypothetical protein KJ564_08820, partial [bacterium]|nr:hypothetical protein [bacterium]